MVMKLDDRFSQPSPPFKAPNEKENLGCLLPLRPKSQPASVPLKERRDNDNVQRLLEQAKLLSGKMIAEFPTSKPIARINPIKLTYTAAHVMNDEQFIRTTRMMSITDKGAMSLLLANGGSKFLEQGLLPAQAWDALRKEKMNAVSKKVPGKDSDKRQVVEGTGYTPGTPTVEDRMRKMGWHVIEGGKSDE